MTDSLIIAGKTYGSRLLVGTGKYNDFAETRAAVDASGAQIVTVAIRRTNIGQNANEPSLLDALPPSKYTFLPNTAGCYTADDAVRTLRLARELLDGHDLVKLEVLGDPQTLYPNMAETLKAAETLVKEGFKVMVYCSDDPIQAQKLEEIGCVAVMPLASLIGSGMGILNPWNLQIIIEKAEVPVIVDAGVGTASDAAIAMELGCDGVLMNTAIAAAQDPVLMAAAMKQGGRGRTRGLPRRPHAEEALLGHAELAHRRKDLVEGRLNRPIRSFVLRQGRTTPAQRPRARAAATRVRHRRSPTQIDSQHLRPQRAAGARDRLRHGRDHDRHRRGAPGGRFLAIEVHGPGVGSLLNASRRRS